MLLDSKNILKDFVGNKNAVVNLINSLKSSNYTGAWLLSGPKGVGKAKISEDIIKILLDIKNSNDALLHPDLFVLKKKSDEKKFISVEEVRKVSVFHSKTSIKGHYKVVFIDSMSDLNNFGYNSLLKTLEDYGIGTSFFIIDHMNTIIPNTIKSRCRKIIFKKLNTDEIKNLIKSSNIKKEDQHSYSMLSNGSIGNAYDLEKNNALEIHKIFCDYILNVNDIKKIHKMLQSKKNNSNIFTISFLMIFRILRNTLKKINNFEISYLNDIEEKVIEKLSNTLTYNQIMQLLDILYKRKKDINNFNLDYYSCIYLTLDDLKKNINQTNEE